MRYDVYIYIYISLGARKVNKEHNSKIAVLHCNNKV